MELFYREFGSPDNKPLIILHGLFGMSDNWMTIARALADRGMYVLVPDQRNHGRSGHSDVFNYTALVDDLYGFMDDRGLESSFLLGHSMGGKTAMQFSLDYPERSDGLIVADISPAESSHGRAQTLIIDSLLKIGVENYENRREVDRALAGIIENDRLRMFLQKNLYHKDKSSLGWRINLKAVRDNLDEVFSPVHHSLPFDKKVLFIRGDRSDYVPDDDLGLIKEIFPKSRVSTIKGAGHWLHAEKQDEFLKEVYGFMGV